MKMHTKQFLVANVECRFVTNNYNSFLGGYFLNQQNQDLTPGLDNEERKKLGLVYYKPVAKELADYLQTTNNNLNERNDPQEEPEKSDMNQFEKIKSEIHNELKELDVIGKFE